MVELSIKRVLIANRSEIAIRVIHACRTLSLSTVAVYSEADVNSLHRKSADQSVLIGPPSPSESYLSIDKIIDAAKESSADAIHPGYGFLAENPLLASRCKEEGITFIGPSVEAINLMGNKVAARTKMQEAGVPLIPGMKDSGGDIETFTKAAKNAGYPVIIKAAAGGGGKGMRVVNNEKGLADAIDAARREAGNAFGDDTIYLEKYIENPRHIEFQVFGDSHGKVVHLFERECSIQRRHQKIIEETPSVALDENLRKKMGDDAVKVAKAANYVGAGTVEFLLDKSGNYYFLEMNTRIQVEHPITEMVCGVDLVVEQIRVAAGCKLSESFLNLSQRGHAIECRIYAEDGESNFMPSTGKILYYSEPSGPGIRVDSGVECGTEISIDYDPIMAKLIVHAPDRETAISKMISALKEYRILGVKTSRRFMIDCLCHEAFKSGKTYTNFLDMHMQSRERNELDTESAAVAVAVSSANRRPVVATTASSSMPSPWETIGNWEIGSSINE